MNVDVTKAVSMEELSRVSNGHPHTQVEKMANTPINPNIHLDNDLLGKSYQAAVRYFREDFPDSGKLYIIAGDQDQIVDPLQARTAAFKSPRMSGSQWHYVHAPCCRRKHEQRHSCVGASQCYSLKPLLATTPVSL